MSQKIQKNRLVAIIPARSGSKRIPDKNITLINGHPLIAYTIHAAKESGIFDKVYVATDSALYAEIAISYGAEVPSLRANSISGDHAPDILWVNWAITEWGLSTYEALAILRPTSPLRSSDDIRKAWKLFSDFKHADSIRAVTKSSIHPGKMWTITGDLISPVLSFHLDGVPWHSCQTAKLQPVFFQNASLEIVWIESVLNSNTISGSTIIPYFSDGHSGFDINEPLDLLFLDFLISIGEVSLPKIQKPSDG